MLKNIKGQKGITLVALVVTIVVLLILAAVTISLVFAQNGVVTKAQEAAKESNKGTIADNIQGFVVSKQMKALKENAEQTDISTELIEALADVGIEHTGTGTIKVNANTSVEVSGDLTFSVGDATNPSIPKYKLASYTNGYPELELVED